MKIVQVCQRYHPDLGGVETHVELISENLVKKGLDVEVVCTDASRKLPKREIINGVKVTRFWAFSPDDTFFFSPAMYFYLRGLKYDVIHAHNYRSFPALFASLTKGKSKFVFTPHLLGFQRRKLLHLLYKPLGNSIFHSADMIVSISKAEMEWLGNNFDIKDKVVCIPHPIKIPEKVPFTGEIKKIGYVGRLSQEKNVDILIHAFKKLRGSYSGIDLFLAGDGPQRSYLEKIAGPGVHFLGRLPREDVYKFLEYVDLVILPSQFEVAPLSILEAMARSRPIIVTPVGELPNILRDEKECLFVKIGDSEDLAEKITNLIENEELSKYLSENGRILMEERYDTEKVINEYVKIYNGFFRSISQ